MARRCSRPYSGNESLEHFILKAYMLWLLKQSGCHWLEFECYVDGVGFVDVCGVCAGKRVAVEVCLTCTKGVLRRRVSILKSRGYRVLLVSSTCLREVDECVDSSTLVDMLVRRLVRELEF